jgi:hypothetical protein
MKAKKTPAENQTRSAPALPEQATFDEAVREFPKGTPVWTPDGLGTVIGKGERTLRVEQRDGRLTFHRPSLIRRLDTVTVRDIAFDHLLQRARARLGKLEAIAAPDIIIERVRTTLIAAAARDGSLMADPDGAGARVAIGPAQVRKGTGGREYLAIPTAEGETLFFPLARHRPLIRARAQGAAGT